MPMFASKKAIWHRRAFQIICTLLLLSNGEAARVIRFALRKNLPSRVVVEVIHQTTGVWCVASQSASNSDLQAALDWACGQLTGQGNVDCSPISDGGACYTPNTLAAHASYAMNAYFQKEAQAQGSCSFNNIAQEVYTDPSSGACTYASSSTSFSSPNISTTSPTTFGNTSTNSNGSSPPASWQFISTFTFALLVLVIGLRL